MTNGTERFYAYPMTAHIMFTYGGLKVDAD